MTIYHFIAIAGELFSMAVVPTVLIRRREPASTFAWILVLLFLPLLGALLYLAFGRDRIASSAYPAVAEGADAVSDAGPDAPDRLARVTWAIAARLSGLPATEGNSVTALIDGDETYAAIGAAIDGAQRLVEAEYYLIYDDAIGAWFAERLAAAARRGVEVRLLRDGYGSFWIGRRWLRPLRAAGVRVATFLPLRRFLFSPPSLRNHRKIVIVDGTIGFTGGVNLTAQHSRRCSGELAWRDIHLRLAGPAAAQLRAVFAKDWLFATGEVLAAEAAGAPAPVGTARVAIITSGPDSRVEAIHRVFFAAITAASREIIITSPYFIPDETLLVALEVAAERRVDVRLMVPARSNHRVSFHASRSLYERLLEAGVRIFEYQPAMLHAKAIVIDGQVALVGTSNMDLRSFRLNFEIQALVDCLPVIERLRSAFAENLVDCVAIDHQLWRARGLGQVLMEGAARLVAPLL